AVAVRGHGHDCWKVADFQVPHRFRGSELHERHTGDAIDAAGIELRRAADTVQVNTSGFLQTGECFRTHSALPDHDTDTISLQDLRLVRLFANARCRPAGSHLPLSLRILHDHRATVIKNRPA